MLKKNEDGSFTLNIPAPADVKIHTFDGADVGRWVGSTLRPGAAYVDANKIDVVQVVPVLKDRSKYAGMFHCGMAFRNRYIDHLPTLGKSLHAVAEFISAREFAEILNRVTGKNIKLAEVTQEQFYTDEYRKAISDELWLK